MRLRQIGIQPGAYLLGADVAPQLPAEHIRHRGEHGHTVLRTGDSLCGYGEDALAQGGRLNGTAHLEGAEVAGQEVRQPSFQAVIDLVPLQNLELRLKLASGPALRHPKQRDHVRGQREDAGIEEQPPGHDCLTDRALDQQLGG